MARTLLRLSVTALVIAIAPPAAAKAVWDEYSDLVKGSQEIKALGHDLFGDQVSLQHGSLSFQVTDVSLRGNNTLRVALTRTFSTNTRSSIFGSQTPQTNVSDGALRDWEIDLPYIGGVFATSTGWSYVGTDGGRCSAVASGARPPVIGNFTPDDYFSGTEINIPGVGRRSLLVNASGIPRPLDASGNVDPQWLWTTTDWTAVKCLPSIANGNPDIQGSVGEGFVARTSDGTEYTFNWLSTTHQQTLKKPSNDGFGFDYLPRGRYRLYATLVKDRHGNTVTYTYNTAIPANQPARLTEIKSSDGRVITLTWNPEGGFVETVTVHGRNWTYGYSDGRLTSVVLPDSSSWTISLPGFKNLPMDYYRYGSGEPYRGCGWPGDMVDPEPDAVATITHPSGAKGEFTLRRQRFMRYGIDPATNCAVGNVNLKDDDTEYLPTVWDSWALTTKKLSGPGLGGAGLTWSYIYNSGTTTEVSGPGGAYTRYTFGDHFNSDDGDLLRVQRGASATDTPYDESYGYHSVEIGRSNQPRKDRAKEDRIRAQESRILVLDGVTFQAGASGFDGFWRPTRVVRKSSLGYSKTEATVYRDNRTKWVLGQIERRCRVLLTSDPCTATDGLTTEFVEYHTASDLPWKSYSFGELTQTLTYDAVTPDALGTVSTVADGRNNTTTLSSWKRGVPQSIVYADTSTESEPVNISARTESATVDDNGWIISTTDETGSIHQYYYDRMGRLSWILYPASDSVVWNPTTLEFVRVATPEYGLEAGHWKQTISTGASRKVTYFDALWRPVVVEQYDNSTVEAAAATRSVGVSRYDAAGRLAFQSTALASLVDFTAPISGVRTTYDVLDRPLRIEQDSELDVLVTTTEYLPGFKRRITNPRGNATTEEFQVFDLPTYDFPVRVSSPEGVVTDISRDQFGKPKEMIRTGQGL